MDLLCGRRDQEVEEGPRFIRMWRLPSPARRRFRFTWAPPPVKVVGYGLDRSAQPRQSLPSRARRAVAPSAMVLPMPISQVPARSPCSRLVSLPAGNWARGLQAAQPCLRRLSAPMNEMAATSATLF